MTSRVWTDGSAKAVPKEIQQGPGVVSDVPRERGRMERHTEFVVGVDWCLFGGDGWAGSVGWDERVCIWDVRDFMGP